MNTRYRWFLLTLLVILSLLGMTLLWRSTPYGLGLVNDSATYFEGASSILAGRGYVRISGGGEIKPITHFPPLFSLLLAGIGKAGVDMFQGARILVTVLFGVSILLVGLSIYKISHSLGFACLGALFLAVSDLHLGVYSFALSEPLFLSILLAAYLSLSVSLDHSHWMWSALSGFLLSLAYLTRYAGVSLFITVILVMILLRPPKTITRIGVMLAGALPPLLFWLVYNLATSGPASIGNRQLLWHPIPIRPFFEALKNLLTWIAPNDLLSATPLWGRLFSLLSLLLIAGLIAWLAWMVWQMKNVRKQPKELAKVNPLAFIQALHIPIYLGFLVISLTIFDASTPLDDRILSVIYLPEIIIICSAIAWLWNKLRQRATALGWALVVLCLALAIFNVKDGYAAMTQLSLEGQGFTHRGISSSPAIQVIRQMPPTILYSNKPGAIFLLTGKSAYVTPTPIDPVTELTRTNYNNDRLQMQQRVKDGKAILVLFGLRSSNEQDEVNLYADLSEGLPIWADYGNIVIFGTSP